MTPWGYETKTDKLKEKLHLAAIDLWYDLDSLGYRVFERQYKVTPAHLIFIMLFGILFYLFLKAEGWLP